MTRTCIVHGIGTDLNAGLRLQDQTYPTIKLGDATHLDVTFAQNCGCCLKPGCGFCSFRNSTLTVSPRQACVERYRDQTAGRVHRNRMAHEGRLTDREFLKLARRGQKAMLQAAGREWVEIRCKLHYRIPLRDEATDLAAPRHPGAAGSNYSNNPATRRQIQSEF